MRLLIGLLAAFGLFGQSEDRLIVVPVNREVTLQFDEISVDLYVTTPAATEIDEVLGGLAFTGVQAMDLFEYLPPRVSYTYHFRFRRPVDEFGGIYFGLKELGANRPGWMIDIACSLVLSVSEAQVAGKRRELLSSVEKEGRSLAEQIARSLGARVGALVGSDETPGGTFELETEITGSVFEYPRFNGGGRVVGSFGMFQSGPAKIPANRMLLTYQLSFAMESL